MEMSHALIECMYDSADIKATISYSLEVSAENIEWLLVEFINELLSYAGRKKLFIRPVESVKVFKERNEFIVRALVTGEPIGLRRHTVKTEVKGATYSGLYVKDTPDGYAYQVLVDV